MFPYVHETSPGKNAIFPSIYLPHIHHGFPSSLGLWFVAQPYPIHICLMWFLYVRPEVCLRLPSDSTSRWTPLPLAMCLALLTRTQDLHLLDCSHAGRTRKRKLLGVITEQFPLFSLFTYLFVQRKCYYWNLVSSHVAVFKYSST